MNVKLDEELRTEYRKEVQAKLVEALVSYRFHELLAQKLMLLPDKTSAEDSARARMGMHASKNQSEVLEQMLEEIEEEGEEECPSLNILKMNSPTSQE
jgi:hypothetical protein